MFHKFIKFMVSRYFEKLDFTTIFNTLLYIKTLIRIDVLPYNV